MNAPGAPRVPAQRILIVLLGAIGDVVRGLPLLQRLRAGYPNAAIAWAAEPAAAALLQHHPALNEVVCFDRGHAARDFVPFLRRVRALRPDLTLDLQHHLKSGIISRVSGARLRLGFDRHNAREGNWLFNTHRIAPQEHYSSKLQQYLRFADWLGLPDDEISFGLLLRDDEQRRVEALLREVRRPFIAAFVGSSCESRFWFAERTAAVADAFAARGIDTVLLGGSADVEYAQETARLAQAPLHNLAGQTSLRDLVGVFQRCAVAYGPDSGPMHIAAAAGARVISMWGATSAKRSAPWNNQAGVIEGSAPCMPCYRKTCPIGRQCMQAISVERVVATLETELAFP